MGSTNMSVKHKLLWCAMGGVLLVAVAGGVYYWHVTLTRHRIREAKPVRSYHSMEQHLSAIAASSEAITLTQIGTVTFQEEGCRIWMLSWRPPGEIKIHALLTGGIHGNEPAGANALIQFAERLAKDILHYPGMAIDIVPVVNPWGWVHEYRHNGAGIDLNREFNSFNAEESVLMRSLCANHSYDIMIDCHEDGQVSGFYFYRLANPKDEVCKHIIQSVHTAGFPIHEGRVSYIFYARDGIIDCPLWSLYLARLVRQLSMSNYFRLEGCPQSFLFETPKKLPLHDREAMHRIAIEALLDIMAQQTGQQ